MSENDQPYSKQWESYSVEGLDGGSAGSDGGFLTWEQVFTQMRPTCPKCGTKLSPSDMS